MKMSPTEQKFLRRIVADPGIAAADLPRADRGKTIKALEGAALIHFGPGGWFPTATGELAAKAIVDSTAKPRVEVNTRAYRSAHGAEPKGRGSWGFVMGKVDYDLVDECDAEGRRRVWFAPGSMTFAEARKLVVIEARSRGVSLIGVCS